MDSMDDKWGHHGLIDYGTWLGDLNVLGSNPSQNLIQSLTPDWKKGQL